MENIINTSVAPVYRRPSFQSEMVTEAFLWETVMVLDENHDWLKIRQEDGYEGWIHQFYLISGSANHPKVHMVLQDRITPVYTAPMPSSGISDYLSVGTMIPDAAVTENTDPFLEIIYPCGKTGWLAPKKPSGKNTRSDLIKSAMGLIGTPYLWGGKSGFGMDCSGFVQTVFLTQGIKLPRDSGLQYQVIPNVDQGEAMPGDLIFFRDEGKISHVGIFTSDGRFIHCSGRVRVSSMTSDDPQYENRMMGKFDSIRSIGKLMLK